MPTDYFNSLMANERMLARHGFTSWPSEIELATYVFDQIEKYDSMFRALGMTAHKANSGQWILQQTKQAM